MMMRVKGMVKLSQEGMPKQPNLAPPRAAASADSMLSTHTLRKVSLSVSTQISYFWNGNYLFAQISFKQAVLS